MRRESPRTPSRRKRRRPKLETEDEFPERRPLRSDPFFDGRPLDASPMIVRPFDGGVEVLAPAKLNLFLEILGRRADGYHEVETLMVAVDLYDTLIFADDPSGRITLRCDDPTLPTGRDNLVVRTAERLQAESGCPR